MIDHRTDSVSAMPVVRVQSLALERLYRARDLLLKCLSQVEGLTGTGRAEALSRVTEHLVHVWTFWAAPDSRRPALVIPGDWSLTPVCLLGLFSKVDVWETDTTRARVLRTVAADLGLRLSVEYQAMETLPRRLAGLQGAYALIALEDSFRQLSRRDSRLRNEVLGRLRQAAGSKGQCCVVSRNRFALDDLRERFLRRTAPTIAADAPPTPGEIRRGFLQGGRVGIRTILLHPDHRIPTEILGWSGRLPETRRHLWGRILDRLGVIERLHGSFACMTSGGTLPSLLERATDMARSWTLDGHHVRWGDCRIRDRSMLLLTLRLGRGNKALLRIPLSRDALQTLGRAVRTNRALARELPRIHQLCPEALPVQDQHGWPCYVERVLPGVPGSRLIHDDDRRSKVRNEVLRFLLDLHLSTLQKRTVDLDFVEKQYRNLFATIRDVEPRRSDDLEALANFVAAETLNRTLPIVRIHGDPNVGNVLFDPKKVELTGVIDWEASQPDSLPFDVLHYLISEKRELRRAYWGEVVTGVVAGTAFDDRDRAFIKSYHEAIGFDHALFLPLLVVYWARCVAIRIGRSEGPLRPRWREKNLVEPLDALCRLVS